ncbi:MAG: hypothetical protein GWP04_01840 [Gammaproteobacteria bacterium]|nr:hypothetical protein [Gammaproteobacteria bacterium]
MRAVLGAIVTVLLIGGTVVMLSPSVDEPTRLAAGMAVRVGVLFGAVWLAFPDLRRVRARIAIPLAAVGLALLYRPRLAALLLPVAVAIIVLTPRFSRRKLE